MQTWSAPTVLALLVSLLLPIASCTLSKEDESPASSRGNQALLHLIDKEWRNRLTEDPWLATLVGETTANDALPSVSKDDLQRRFLFDQALMSELDALPASTLSEDDRTNLELLRRQVEDRIAGFRFGAYQIPLNADSGFHIAFARLPREVPLETREDFENYFARLHRFPAHVDQQIANMQEGMSRGMTLPRVVLEGYEVTIQTHVVDDPKDSLFYKPLLSLPTTFSSGTKNELERLGRAAVSKGAVAGYRKFLKFMTEEYIPNCRTTIGASELPRGRDYYQQRVEYFTTLPMTPESIHELGLKEVARIRGEMQEILDQLEFQGDLTAFIEFLRTDPRFYAKTPEELLKEASFIAKRMDARLPTLFKNLPRLPYGVAKVPDHLAPKYTGGRYVPPAHGSHEPGYYWVNTYALKSRPLYVLTALTLHEAVPGHHLQHGLALEQAAQPPFRRHDYISAYGEGWGLYSEWLGLEAGLYENPYDNFGRLTYEMWRACRLVVDTGLHAFGWTREEVMDYLAENTALSLHEIRTETDRYISWPAQALSYKIGELKIKELRQQAAATLGPEFDLREFHDEILRIGNVTLPILERVIQNWIRERQNLTSR